MWRTLAKKIKQHSDTRQFAFVAVDIYISEYSLSPGVSVYLQQIVVQRLSAGSKLSLILLLINSFSSENVLFFQLSLFFLTIKYYKHIKALIYYLKAFW